MKTMRFVTNPTTFEEHMILDKRVDSEAIISQAILMMESLINQSLQLKHGDNDMYLLRIAPILSKFPQNMRSIFEEAFDNNEVILINRYGHYHAVDPDSLPNHLIESTSWDFNYGGLNGVLDENGEFHPTYYSTYSSVLTTLKQQNLTTNCVFFTTPRQDLNVSPKAQLTGMMTDDMLSFLVSHENELSFSQLDMLRPHMITNVDEAIESHDYLLSE